MVRAGGAYKDHEHRLQLQRAAQRCANNFGGCLAAYHAASRLPAAAEVRPPLHQPATAVPAAAPAMRDVRPPASTAAPAIRQPATAAPAPNAEIHQELLQCSDCREYKTYEFFYRTQHRWSLKARRCMICHDRNYWDAGPPIPVHLQDAQPAPSGERNPWADETDSAA